MGFYCEWNFYRRKLIVDMVFGFWIAFSIGFFCGFSEGFSNDCGQLESLSNDLWKRYALYINLVKLVVGFTSGLLVLKYLNEASHDPDEKR